MGTVQLKGRSTEVNEDYLSIFVDAHGHICEVQYLGVDKPLVQNWLSLIGLNERYVGNLAVRFDEGIVPDLVE